MVVNRVSELMNNATTPTLIVIVSSNWRLASLSFYANSQDGLRTSAFCFLSLVISAWLGSLISRVFGQKHRASPSSRSGKRHATGILYLLAFESAAAVDFPTNRKRWRDLFRRCRVWLIAQRRSRRILPD